MSAITVPAPAKINLFLAVTGRRADGFHELVSVVAPLAWGDEIEIRGQRTGDGATELTVAGGGDEVPRDNNNLVLKAAREFRAATGWSAAATFGLKKRVPVGAGLGGGSSDAAAALRGLNAIAGRPLGPEALVAVAARVGSDCASLLHDGPVVMRGRGERIEVLPASAAARLSGRRVLVFKPAFGIATAWAYGRLARMHAADAAGGYAEAAAAEAKLAAWSAGTAPAEDLLFNSLERPAFEKFPALPLLLERLRREFGVAAGMSGSGSACFVLLSPDAPVADMTAVIREAWGNTSFSVETALA
ncbi:MAG TPA: 4-(cytidine 5'-diphospho)-2-C-methyl-D-erythritol kinase [Opitutus sp.]|nr:4-(cytidine 5'-diphospho)-2-C-methyl-D-erythritol kinase [Opitutus sp.]